MEINKTLIRDIAFNDNVNETYAYLVMYLLNKGSNTEIETFLRLCMNPWNPKYVPKLKDFNNDDIIIWLSKIYKKIIDVYEVKDLDPIAGKVTICFLYEDEEGETISDEINVKYIIENGKINLV